jgi:hypothetical protein
MYSLKVAVDHVLDLDSLCNIPLSNIELLGVRLKCYLMINSEQPFQNVFEHFYVYNFVCL